jgi:hypothetical protein
VKLTYRTQAGLQAIHTLLVEVLQAVYLWQGNCVAGWIPHALPRRVTLRQCQQPSQLHNQPSLPPVRCFQSVSFKPSTQHCCETLPSVTGILSAVFQLQHHTKNS